MSKAKDPQTPEEQSHALLAALCRARGSELRRWVESIQAIQATAHVREPRSDALMRAALAFVNAFAQDPA